MASTELRVEIKAKLDVDKKTAEACLKLAEIYVNANGYAVVQQRLENGEIRLEYCKDYLN